MNINREHYVIFVQHFYKMRKDGERDREREYKSKKREKKKQKYGRSVSGPHPLWSL